MGALEPAFFAELLRLLEIDPDTLGPQRERAGWPAMRDALSDKFRKETRDHWARVFADSDACVTPVLTATEAIDDPHMRARNVFVDVDGIRQRRPRRASPEPRPRNRGPRAWRLGHADAATAIPVIHSGTGS
ncbi:CoA transferase [Mycobacterium intracellulare]|uniref:CoA transferase n=1 Tax=Mycobacterium intracellulare TaxID=1767 RepID=A0AAE4U2T6_MYCIT|nr:CoA transferase [Mycobacterium intracellulare]MDV6976918.1 CoA transferase [Mycobacterium intracellulare]MDV6982215.1 CoA transferase [Mycobacterium intracellulare]MDV7012000.1 CoA transferase [Mycobacterium intracellulare]MDV7026936.1 CoA transferase [Mycobacterium intracellulare]